MRLDSDLTLCDDGHMTFALTLLIIAVIALCCTLGISAYYLIFQAKLLKLAISVLNTSLDAQAPSLDNIQDNISALRDNLQDNTLELQELRLTSRARMAAVTGGNRPRTPMDPEYEAIDPLAPDGPQNRVPTPDVGRLARMGRLTQSKRVVVGGEEDSPLAESLAQSVGIRSPALEDPASATPEGDNS